MDQILIKKLRNNSGAALIFVIVALVVFVIFLAAVSTLFQTNLFQARAQEDNLKAYYISLAGSDLCFAALLQEGPGGENDTLLYKEFSIVTKPVISSTPVLTDTLTLTGGAVTVTVQAITVNGQRWVEIKSGATLDSSNAVKTTSLQFQVSNPLVQKKS